MLNGPWCMPAEKYHASPFFGWVTSYGCIRATYDLKTENGANSTGNIPGSFQNSWKNAQQQVRLWPTSPAISIQTSVFLLKERKQPNMYHELLLQNEHIHRIKLRPCRRNLRTGEGELQNKQRSGPNYSFNWRIGYSISFFEIYQKEKIFRFLSQKKKIFRYKYIMCSKKYHQ